MKTPDGKVRVTLKDGCLVVLVFAFMFLQMILGMLLFR